MDATPTETTEPANRSLGGLRFSKGHGTGNDFVLIADPDGVHTIDAGQVAALCDRHRGIGGDGLIRAVPSRYLSEGRELLQTSPAAEWFMDYRNGDGSLSEMCGNGVRVFVHFLRAEGLVDLPDGGSLTIGTRGGPKTVVRTGDNYAVDMGPWEFIFPGEATAKAMDSLVTADGLEVPRPALSVSMGNPHTVVALAELPSWKPPGYSPPRWWIPCLPTAPTSNLWCPPNRSSTMASAPSPCVSTNGASARRSRAAPVPALQRWPPGTGQGPRRRTPGWLTCRAASSGSNSSPGQQATSTSNSVALP
ncbi:MAG: hypothetical protein PVSMB10_00300 [Pseudarthrobacter sp.]